MGMIELSDGLTIEAHAHVNPLYAGVSIDFRGRGVSVWVRLSADEARAYGAALIEAADLVAPVAAREAA